MKCRIWRTEVVPGRFEEYEMFARNISLPMFRNQPGFKGVLMAGEGPERLVITLWRDDNAITALDHSASYRETVNRIMAAGFITGHQSVEIHNVHLGDLNVASPIEGST